jgi:hypothetical protein
MYNGTNTLIGALQPELELEVVGAAVAALVVGAVVAGLVVAAAVAGLVVAAAVTGLVVAAEEGLEVAEGLTVADFVAAAVALEADVGLEVAGLAVALLPEYVTPVSTTPTDAEVMMLFTVTWAPLTEVSLTETGNLKLPAEDTVKYPHSG